VDARKFDFKEHLSLMSRRTILENADDGIVLPQ
jgi:hypothetical protein